MVAPCQSGERPLTLTLSPKGRGDKAETPSRTESSRPARRSRAIHTWDDIPPGNDVTEPLILTLSRKGRGDQTEVAEARGRNPIEDGVLVS